MSRKTKKKNYTQVSQKDVQILNMNNNRNNNFTICHIRLAMISHTQIKYSLNVSFLQCDVISQTV